MLFFGTSSRQSNQHFNASSERGRTGEVRPLGLGPRGGARGLMARAGGLGTRWVTGTAAVLTVLAVGAGWSIAQEGTKPDAGASGQPAEKPAEEPKSPAGGTGGTSDAPISAEELLKKLKQDAERMGVNFQDPKSAPPAPKPATTANPAPDPKMAEEPKAGNNPAARPVPLPESKGVGGGVGGMPQAAPAVQVPAQPRAAGGHEDIVVNVPEGMVRLDFTDAVDLLVLVKFVQETLGLQLIVQDGGLANQKVLFTQPIVIERGQLLTFLQLALEQKDYTIAKDAIGLLTIQPRAAVAPNMLGGEFSTTKLIPTPNIKPSTLQQAIQTLLSVNRQGGVQASPPTFFDDLGMLLITESPRNIALVETFIGQLVKARSEVKWERFELANISAASARERLLELMGQAQQRLTLGQPGQPGQPAQQILPGGPGASISNLNERLTVDPTSNSILFRGRVDEGHLVGDLLKLVDVPNSLVSKFYPVGLSTSEAVASAGRREQLGDTTTFESSGSRGRTGATSPIGNVNQAGGFGGGTDFVGSGFVLYPEAGGFIYRGTESQHRRVMTLVDSLRDLSERDRVVIEFYKLRNGKAEDVATVVQSLLTNSSVGGNRGGLLGRDLGGANRPRTPGTPNTRSAQNQPQPAAAAGADGGALGDLAGEDVFVTADTQNNQIVVKAPAKLQPQFRQLIDRIDLRRPQVYLDAKIVVVTSTDSLDLAIEAQQIIGSFAFNTNFGLSTLGAVAGGITGGSTGGLTGGGTTTGGSSSSGNLQAAKIPNTGNQGITAALIRSRDVPLLINALARNVSGRVIATPQLLVDDNSEGEIKSKDAQPTRTTSQSGSAGSTVSGFGGFEEAGPSLKIKPQIAEGGVPSAGV